MKWVVGMEATIKFTVEVEAKSEDEAYQIVDSKDTSYKKEIVEKLNADEYRTEVITID